jgi:hypothetical protein
MLRDKLKEKTLEKQTRFRFRGVDNTRIEALSDGVFALAFALLVISTSIPRTYAELIIFLDDLVPFSICIILLVLIWFQHYVFFIRYGFKDATIVSINTFLLILILFYIYPLKFLFQILFTLMKGLVSGNDRMLQELFTETLPIDKAPNLMIIYGVGAALIFFTLALMYRIAYKRKEKLKLTRIEAFDTQGSMFNNLLMGSIPMLSALISMIGVGDRHTFTVAGFTYWLYPIIMPAFGTYRAKRKRKLIKELDEEPAEIE